MAKAIDQRVISIHQYHQPSATELNGRDHVNVSHVKRGLVLLFATVFLTACFHDEDNSSDDNSAVELTKMGEDLSAAFFDWTDRTKLPKGFTADPDATLTLVYANNTIYGSRQGLTGEGSELGPASYKGISNGSAMDWTIRPYNYKVTLLNADNFDHGYMNVDFGGMRGWENQFQETDPTTTIDLATGEPIFPMNKGGTDEHLEADPRPADFDGPKASDDPQLGSGCFFTFGRNWAWPNAGGPGGGIMVPAVAEDGTPGQHRVEITYNFEPSRRLKIYQFDPLHHDVAIYSLH